MKKISNILEETRGIKRPTNLYTEHQQYGVYLADCLGDPKHYSLYIKMAKNMDRRILEDALSFCKEYHSAKSKARIFMWRLKQLRQEAKERIA
jgi:hypothetical protein